ncbi:MAG: hypothetical protein NC124_08280 [Clostridium sp.]|nr:hypothetical protein [Clostridium sp.]
MVDRMGMAKAYHGMDNNTKNRIDWSVYDFLLLFGCIVAGALMIARCFFGTEITDEAYYVADAKAMLEGNLPYAYCTYSYGSGSCFLLIPLIALYRIFQPELTGVFLFSRICFLVLWYLILIMIYRILCKNVRRCHALLFVGMLIPYKCGIVFFNFSYNTVPCVLILLAAFLLYDVLENRSRYGTLEILVSGFTCGIAFFAQPGYGLAIVVFGILLLIRSRGAKEKIKNICCYAAGGVAEVCVVFIPIIIQAGFATVWAGVSRYFHSYPSNATMSVMTPRSRAWSLVVNFRQFVILFIIIAPVIYLFSRRYVRENEQKLSNKEYQYIGIAVAGCLLIASFLKNTVYSDAVSYMVAMIGTIMFCALLLCKAYEKQMLLIYVGIYPILFAVGEAICVDSGNSIGRFTAGVPTLAICVLVLLEEKSEIIRLLATVLAGVCVLELGLSVFTHVYRDDRIWNLRYRVEDGVYKGIFTTEARAKALPELETYLNQYIKDGEFYEFHDLAPYGYLMMHTGEPCSIATWDTLNYRYGKNAPAELYEYYRRRQTIPDKLFYVDSGDGISIEDIAFRYNEFVETYYEKIDEVEWNDTFFRVVVYEYRGGFDGDYDYWIDRHMIVPGQ